MFGLNPFTSSIVQHHGDEKCVEVNELQIRTFLKDILRTQIMERGKYLGQAYYRHIVSSILMDVIGAKFALTPDSMLDLLRKFASRTPAKDPLFHTANFLLEENFVAMYVGGTVLSCTQLLDSMVGSMLLKNYPQTREVSLHQYITNLEAIAPFFAKSGPSDTFCLALPRKSPLPPSSRDKTERMKARLSHVEEIVGDIFQKGNSSVGQLVISVTQMIHGVLQVVPCDAQHLFQARVRIKFWASGNDFRLGPYIKSEHVRVIDSLMKLTHAKVAERKEIPDKMDQHRLLLCTDPFFAALKKNLPGQSGDLPADAPQADFHLALKPEERSEAMRFLTTFFDFAHFVHGGACQHAQGGSAFHNAQVALQQSGYGPEQIHALKSRIGCALMALKMNVVDEVAPVPDNHSHASSECSPAGDFVTPCFVGGESIGKSTLINFAIKPGGHGDVQPTGRGMVTQFMTVIKHSETDGLFFGDQRVKSGANLQQAMVEKGWEYKSKRSQQKVSLDNPLITRFTPFETEIGRSFGLRLVDVPGIKPETELETALAFGACSCIVLCAADAKTLKLALEKGGPLRRLKSLYDYMSSPPPILLAITRQHEFASHQYDQDFSLL